MKTLNDISSEIDNILKTDWSKRDGRVVPTTADIQLGNDAIEMEATILYADLKESTAMVKKYYNWFSAEIYKCYLVACCELIKNNDGVITAFDGDRVMGVYIGDSKNSNATKTALQINYIVREVINKKLEAKYPKDPYQIIQAVGIDTSQVFIARTGIRGDNDLVWVGNAANMAAKMCGIRNTGFSSFISSDVFSKISNETKYGGTEKKLMWSEYFWSDYDKNIYGSSWQWSP
jgi:class 3 adenylate cyclase